MAGSREKRVVGEAFDQVFGGEGTSDLLGRVVARDRTQSGRGHESEKDADATASPTEVPASSPEDYKLTSKLVSPQAYNEVPTAEPQEGIEGPKTPSRSRSSTRKPAAPSNALAERQAAAAKMATSTTVTVSFRMPQEFNQWLDAYVHESWPEKVKKQDLIIEAIRMLIARRGKAGEEILATELLPEKEP